MADWGLAQAVPNFAQSALAGYTAGQQLGRERSRQSALAAYAKNPDDPNAYTQLAGADPELAIQLRHDQEKRAEQKRLRELSVKATQGDPTARAELAGVDFDLWSKLDAKDRAQVKIKNDYIGEAALAISQLPTESRAQAWDAYVDRAKEYGVEGLEAMRGKYSDEGLEAALASSGKIKQFLDTQKIDYQVIPQGGRLQAFDSMGKPIGGGGATQGPQPGHVEDGYRFKGGNPSDPNSWEQVGGPSRSGSGGFP